MRLEGKVTIVTGGATGIGAGICEAFVGEGAKVVIASRDRQRGKAAAARLGCEFEATDITVQDDIDRLVEGVISRHGGIDVLVNNAGVTSSHNPFLDVTREQFAEVMSVNLEGAFFVAQAVARAMVARGGGSIINIGSNISMMAEEDTAHYMASKGGINSLTFAMASELGPLGVRVNTIAPGEIQVETATDVYTSPAGRERLTRLPLRRPGSPSDIAALAVFLASDESAYLSGTVIPVDGGQLAT